jgi:hypothetical protein
MTRVLTELGVIAELYATCLPAVLRERFLPSNAIAELIVELYPFRYMLERLFLNDS